MPDFLTHAMFAQEALDCGGFALHSCCLRHANLFRLGSQGPDLFYYLEYVAPLRGYGKSASALHSLSPVDALELLHELDPREKDWSLQCAYLCGYAAHLCLDQAVHPFVELRAAELSEEIGISRHCAHVMLESRFESRAYFERTGKQPFAYLFRADMPQCDFERSAVIDSCCALLRRCGNCELSRSTFDSALINLPRLFRFLFNENNSARDFLDFLFRTAHLNFSARWRIKRRFDGSIVPFTEADYMQSCDLYDKALAEYLHLVSD
ncbi:MAG: hypothetical protein RR998_06635 [Oscillospiraceae bacterium]